MAQRDEGLDEAVDVLRAILVEVGERPRPPAAGDDDLWVTNAAAVVDATKGLEVSGWLCTVAALTLWGPRTQADPSALATYVAEAEGGDHAELTGVFGPVVAQWQALGAVDDNGRLTELGWWGLPEALLHAWTSSGDTPEAPG